MDGLSLTGRVAVVTGAAGAIGSAIATDLAALGARVVVADVDAAGAERVAAGLPGGAGVAAEVDLADDASIAAFAAAVTRDHGPVDVLVNNAGITQVERFADSDPATWDRQWQVNLKAPMLLTQALVGGMVERRWGRVVFVASDGARAGAGGEAVYTACKAGLFGFARSLAREVARAEVTSNVVCPGPTDTPMTRAVQAEKPQLVEALVRSIPLRRLGRPEDVAATVAFLCSGRAGYVTGQTLSVSGGITMQ
ncbi:MAG TPA: SDR family oxidoreductase [Acidimicrobiales bacterium]